MALTAATLTFGPDDGQLVVTTGTAGPAARAGHDLTIVAEAWGATLRIAEQAGADALALSVDPGSLVVTEARGGASPLSEEDKAGISTTVQREILGTAPIRFESTQISRTSDDQLRVTGLLELAGVQRSVSVHVRRTGDRLAAHIPLRQTDYGIKPYTVLFGALRVADELTVSFDVAVPAG